jgi:hypothetical protein
MDLQPGQFGNYELRYHSEDMGERKPRHFVEAYHEGEKVGSLNWYGTTGTVGKIDVEDEHQRRGVATAMWDHAQSLKGVRKPKHSNDRTTQGDAWMKAVKGRGSRSVQR